MKKTIGFLMTAFCVLSPRAEASVKDPFDVAKTVARVPVDDVCKTSAEDKKLSLADVINLALCNNPTTKKAYLGAMASAAEYGAAKSAYLPTVDASASLTQSDTTAHPAARNANSTRADASLSLNWLLYDFGGRDAAVGEIKYALA